MTERIRTGTDRKQRITGRAANAKGGAVLIPDTNPETGTDGSFEPIYIDGLESWPEPLLGTIVSAIGFLVRENYIPDPIIDAAGAISQGALGEQLLLKNARWEPCHNNK